MAEVTRVRLRGGTTVLVGAPLLTVCERLAKAHSHAVDLEVKVTGGTYAVNPWKVRSLTAEQRPG